MKYEKFINDIEGYLKAEKIEKAEALLNKYTALAPANQQSAPFSANLMFVGEYEGEGGSTLTEAAIAVPALNWISRKIRNARFRVKVGRPDFNGLRIVSEGDSWFQYPVLLEDLIDHISDEASLAVYSLGEAGDTIAGMAREAEYKNAIRRHQPDAFLLSAGGNDVLAKKNLGSILNSYFDNAKAEQLINEAALKKMIDQVMHHYSDMVSSALALLPNLIVYGHGYDNPKPVDGGTWLGGPLQKKGIPLTIGEKVIALILKRFNAELERLETRFSDRFVLLNLIGTVGSSVNSWHDELHPKSKGYSRAAEPFISRLEKQMSKLNGSYDFYEHKSAPVLENGSELHNLNEATNVTLTALMRSLNVARRVSEDDHNIRLERRQECEQNEEVRAAWEDVDALLGNIEKPDTSERRKVRESYSLTQSEGLDERIINENDIDEFNVLERGTKAGKAVGKVMIRMPDGRKGSGSGFLVGPNLLLTNNHVLPTAHIASNSEIFFDYEIDMDGSPLAPVSVKITEDIFYTNRDLDFTFVSLAPIADNGIPLSEFGMLPLLPGSGKALKKERVSIIQHPQGHHKKVALRDNFVLGIARDFLYYVTDTKRGSSGSPVFNLEWQVAALHHRTVPDRNNPDRFLANRGVRISSILGHIANAATDGDSEAQSVNDLVAAGRTGGLNGDATNSDIALIDNLLTDFDNPSDDNVYRDTIVTNGPFAGLSLGDAVSSLSKRWEADFGSSLDEIALEAAAPFSAGTAADAISDHASKLIIDFETGGKAYYTDILKQAATWPGGKSGVTIGFGYDLGYHTANELERDWGSMLSQDELERCQNAIGLTGVKAKNQIPGLSEIRISYDDAEKVFVQQTLPKYVNITFNNLPVAGLEKLHPHCVGALVSLVFNRGASFRKPGDRYREMRAILRHMKNEQFSKIPGEIRSMQRIWAGKGLEGLLRRRENEAQLFQDGLEANETQFAVSGQNYPEDVPFDMENGETLYAEGIDREGHMIIPRGVTVFDETSMPHLNVGHARWASQHNHPDYQHLPFSTADSVFELNSTVIDGLIAVGAYTPSINGHNKLIISLRGCQMVDASNYLENRSSIRLMPATPDHENFRCLIGVFDTTTETISLYRSSTVPRRTGMLRYYNRINFDASRPNCNMLPTGCYQYCVGTHRSESKGGIKYVLRLGDGPEPVDSGAATVQRTSNDLIYGTRDVWDKTAPADNIHPAFLGTSFSSLGCLTVYGSQQGEEASVSTATGGWARFQKAGGFDGKNYDTRYDNMLVTGHEAATIAQLLADDEDISSMICLRHGSRGDRVSDLQSQLGITTDGVFGADTKLKLAQEQISSMGFATGTWNELIAEQMGLTWNE